MHQQPELPSIFVVGSAHPKTYFATQGFGSVALTVTANAVRLLANAGCALVAIYWLDLGATGFFVAVAIGFCAYAALTVAAMLRVKEPAATQR